MSGAAKYELEVDNTADFGSPLYNLTTTNDKAVPTVRLPADDVYWRVRAVSSTGVQSTWATSDLVVDRTAAPAPTEPIDGVQLSQPDDPALLRWSAVRGAIRYHIEVDGDAVPDWVGATAYTSPGPAFQIPAPQAPRVWHWRVRAETASGMYTDWSAGASYEILPLAEVQQDPSMESGGPIQDVVLKWLPVPGAAKYEVQVGLDRDFNQPVETRIVLSTRYSPTTTYNNDQYFWRVRAIDAGGNQMAWPTMPFSFQRSWPQRPELVHPADQLMPAVGDDFYYQWSPVRHATRYQLDVGNDPNFTPNSFESCFTASTTYAAGYQSSTDPCMPGQGLVTYWRVRALDAPRGPAVEGIYSETHRFVYDSGRVNLVAPADGEVVAVPTLRWDAAREAEKYRVELKNAAGTLVGGSPVTTHSLSWTPSSALDSAQGPFSWTVQAVDAGNSTSPKYAGRSFTLAGTPPTTGAPALTPDEVIPGTRFPALSWEPDPAAKSYRIRIGISGSGFWDNTSVSPILTTSYAYPSATDISAYYLSPDTYMWQVQAVHQDNSVTAWGPTGTFVVQPLSGVTGQRIALDGQALDAGTVCDSTLGTVVEDAQICTGVPATPVLDWDPVPGAGGYLVYVGNDREFTNRVYGSTLLPTINSRWTPTAQMNPEALPDNQAGESYYWYVRPCKTINPLRGCGPDPISTDAAATNAFRKISPEVELLAPGANSVNECMDTTTLDGANCAGDIAFSWVDYYATNQAKSYAAGVAPSYQTGQKYRIEIARNAQFSPILHFREVDQPTYTWFDDTLPEGDLWWRVQAIDARNNRLAWSDAAKVTKDSGGVDLVSPIDNVSVAGSTPFAWTPKAHAASYKIEVYKNDDASYSPTNLLFYADNLKLSSYVHSGYLPASSTPYRWRVRWTDAGGELGPWTSGGRFRIEPDQVGLVSPATGSVQPPNGPIFTWDPVRSAVKYTVEARRVGATSSAIRQTTPAAAWATTSPLADNEYEWRVTAYDTSNGALGSSAWRRFTVDTARPTVASKSPATRARAGSNFVATFSEPVTGASSTTMKLYVAGRTTPIEAVVTMSSDRRKATLNPTRNLVVGKRYEVRCTAGIKDDAGNKLVAYKWSVRAVSG